MNSLAKTIRIVFIVTAIIGLIALFLFVKDYYVPPKPTLSFVQRAYNKYATYNESYININQYLKDFPYETYSLYRVQDFASFYLEKRTDVIKSILRAGNRWEPNLIGYMAAYVKKGSTVVDVGAHVGTHTIYFAQLLRGSGTVWAFEPQMKLFVELNANLLANHVKQVKTLRYAAGDRMGVIEMNPQPKGNEGGDAIGHHGDKAGMITIDSLHLHNVSFMKIDVEGYEDHVLDGARNTIQQDKPVILCEIRGSSPVESASIAMKAKIAHTLAKFKQLGYRTVRVSECDYLAIPVTYAEQNS